MELVGRYDVLYVEIRNCNMDTCSNRICIQLITVCPLIDSTLRELFGLPREDDLKKTADKPMQGQLFDPDKRVIVKRTHDKDLDVRPWEAFTNNHNRDRIPDWWDAYNAVKHTRLNEYERTTLRNLLYALATLYSVEMLYAKKVGGLLV